MPRSTALTCKVAENVLPSLSVIPSTFTGRPAAKSSFCWSVILALQISSGMRSLSARIYSSSCVSLSRLMNTGICSPLFGSLIFTTSPKLPVSCKFFCSLSLNLYSWNGRCSCFSSFWMPCSLNLTVPSCAVYNEIFASVGVR